MMPSSGEPSDRSALIAGKYRLTHLVGRGGMGSVWAGIHTTLGTFVAIKFIETQYIENVEARARFENEARAAASLQSRHVVQVFDHGVTHDGRPYIVMEYLSGEPLDKRLDRTGRLGAFDTARLVVQICRGLAKAHQAGIVHRDLKPENIFLVWDADEGADIAKVVDFGIAKFADSSTLTSATRTGSLLGTPYYMSPEQARGLRTVDHRSDLWSVGVIAYQCLVGRLPFTGESVGDLLVTICTAPLPIPSQAAPDVPPAFDAWFARALERTLEGRFPSAAVLAESLCEAMGINIQHESMGMAGRHLVSGVPTPSEHHVKVAQMTPEPVTAVSAANKRSHRATLAVAGIAVSAVGAFAFFKTRTEPDLQATPFQLTTTSRPTVAASPLPPPAAPAASIRVEAPSVTPANPEVGAGSPRAPGGSERAATAINRVRARPSSAAPPAQVAAVEPTHAPADLPGQSLSNQSGTGGRAGRAPMVDIDKDDPWRH